MTALTPSNRTDSDCMSTTYDRLFPKLDFDFIKFFDNGTGHSGKLKSV